MSTRIFNFGSTGLLRPRLSLYHLSLSYLLPIIAIKINNWDVLIKITYVDNKFVLIKNNLLIRVFK